MIIGKNIEAQVEDGKLTLVLDLDTDLGPSASGKSNIVATTSGNVVVDGTEGLVLGINAYRKV